jgi:transcriptional regulator with XRE-family HTH domain
MKLTDRHFNAAIYLAAGLSYTDTAARIGVNPETVGEWCRDKAFQAHLDGLRRYKYDRAVEVLGEFLPLALSGLRHLIMSKNEMVGLRAIEDVLEINDLKKLKIDLAAKVQAEVTTEAEIDAFLKEVYDRHGITQEDVDRTCAADLEKRYGIKIDLPGKAGETSTEGNERLK